VRDSDATLIVVRNRQLSGGTLFTRQCAEKYRKPLLIICEGDDLAQSSMTLRKFIEEQHVNRLNVAGPRESQAPGLSSFVQNLLGITLNTEQAPPRA
jgi:hypothetical protein